MSENSEMMVRLGLKATSAYIGSLLPFLSPQRDTMWLIYSKTIVFYTYTPQVGQERFPVLLRLLDEHLQPLFRDAATARHIKITFSASAYISRIITLALWRTGDDDAATFESSNSRLLQNLVCEERFMNQ